MKSDYSYIMCLADGTELVLSNCINEKYKIKQGTGFSGSFFDAKNYKHPVFISG